MILLGVIIQKTTIQVLVTENFKPFTVLPAVWMWNLVLPKRKICETQTLQACLIIVTHQAEDSRTWPACYLRSALSGIKLATYVKRTQRCVVHWHPVAVYCWYQMVACCSIRWSLGRDKSYTFHVNLHGFPPVTQGSQVTMQCSCLATRVQGDKRKRCQTVAYPGIFFGGGFNKFSWGQRTERTGIWGW